MTILELQNLSISYGSSQALFEVSLGVARGQLVSLIGRNGVGKSTTLRGIMGLNTPISGKIYWKGHDITGREPHLNARDGIGYVPEERRIFANLSVWENLDIVRHNPCSSINAWNENNIFELFPELSNFLKHKGGTLSGGEQQMLTIARTLMGNPELLLLDEPSEGLAPLVVTKMCEKITQLKKMGMSIILAEQNLEVVLSLSDKIYILEKGVVKFSGTPDELRNNTLIQSKYITL